MDPAKDNNKEKDPYQMNFSSTPFYPSTTGFVPLGFSTPTPNRGFRGNNQRQFYSEPKNRNWHNKNSFNRDKGNFRGRQNWNNRQSNNFRKNFNQGKDDIKQYFHPSMLEDPWKDLMEKLKSSNEENTKQLGKTDSSNCEENYSSDSDTSED